MLIGRPGLLVDLCLVQAEQRDWFGVDPVCSALLSMTSIQLCQAYRHLPGSSCTSGRR